MINLLKWRNAELDEKPDFGVVVLVVGDGFNGFALAKYGAVIHNERQWEVYPFGEHCFITTDKVKLWAYLPTETEENIPEPTRDCRIQFFDGKEWAELPHKKITSPEEAYRTIHELGDIPALKATRFRLLGRFRAEPVLPPTYDINFQIQYKEKDGLWVDIPHKTISTRDEAETAIRHLKSGIVFSDVELRIHRMFFIINGVNIDFYKDYRK